MSEAKHGGNHYVNDGCRCETCTEAHRVLTAARRSARYETTRLYGLPDHVAHGSSAYLNWGCRCSVCRSSHGVRRTTPL
jgi:hypothetical protein